VCCSEGEGEDCAAGEGYRWVLDGEARWVDDLDSFIRLEALSVRHPMLCENELTVRGNPIFPNGVRRIDSRITESSKASFFNASKVHVPPTSSSTVAHSERRASMTLSSGSVLARSRIKFCSVKLVECSDTMFKIRSRSATRSGESCDGWPDS
jgi:hypothetical protein